MEPPILSARHITKTYGGRAVLAGVDLDVQRGSITAVLGPNGAGKTTLVRILSTLTPPDSGTATVAGHDIRRDPAAVRAAISLTGQYAALDELLTGAENLTLGARLWRLDRRAARSRINELLERFDLVEAARPPVRTYSGGMKRKLDLAMSLVGRPQLLFLDEPTTGLDPRSRGALWEMMRELKRSGTTMLLTTQYLEEADQLADHIAVVDHGRVVAEGDADTLKRQVGSDILLLRFADAYTARRALIELVERAGVGLTDDEIRVPTDGRPDDIYRILGRLRDASIAVDAITIQEPSLDDVFMALTNRPAANEEIPA